MDNHARLESTANTTSPASRTNFQFQLVLFALKDIGRFDLHRSSDRSRQPRPVIELHKLASHVYLLSGNNRNYNSLLISRLSLPSTTLLMAMNKELSSPSGHVTT
jgi:hypothetical protein